MTTCTGHSYDPPDGGRRPALVVSNDLFQRATGLCLVRPVTRADRRHPFHVALPPGIGVDGVVIADQVRSVDTRARGVRRLARAPEALLDEVLAIVDAMLFRANRPVSDSTVALHARALFTASGAHGASTRSPTPSSGAAPNCGDNGIIDGWAGTRWDRTPTLLPEDDRLLN